jgi:hypothetical protein
MCDFCEGKQDFEIEKRTVYAEPDGFKTICEVISPEVYIDEDGTRYETGVKCSDCCGCNKTKFTIGIKWGDHIYVSFQQFVRDVAILPVSEGLRINFCPMCGKKFETN